MDYGSRYADKIQKIIEFRLQKVYREAKKDLEAKFREFTKQKTEKDSRMIKKVQSGEISEREYKNWLITQVFAERAWKNKVKYATDVFENSNKEALNIIREKQMDVYSENANYEAYRAEKTLGQAVNFTLYDNATVERLIKEKPELLPAKKINGRKDRAWNQGVIANAVTQAIIQGESIPGLAERISKATANTNMKAMVRYARTAMTAAQNAGRMDTMHRAEEIGIRVRKQWLATLDRRTRDSHRQLDGQEQDVDKPFKSELGDIMYPGDPEADPGNVCNCRCTMISVYPKFQKGNSESKRRDNETGKEIEDASYREWIRKKEIERYGKAVGREETDVTVKYKEKAKPGQGKVTYDRDFNEEKEKEEVKIARMLRNIFGGDVHVKKAQEESEGIKYCDYIWRGRNWELKSPEVFKSPDSLLHTALDQIKKTPGGVIIDYKSDDFDLERVINGARKRATTAGFNFDLMILHKGKLVCIKRYSKK